MRMLSIQRTKLRQRGAALIEFSLSILIFFVVVMGIVEFGRALFLINVAGRATQLATRLITVCDISDPQDKIVVNKVRYLLEASGQIQFPNKDWIKITKKNCDKPSTQNQTDPCWISTSLSNLSVKLMIPGVNINIPLPEYQVTQVREAMTSTNNPACTP